MTGESACQLPQRDRETGDKEIVDAYLSDSGFAKQHELDAAARLGSVARVGHFGCDTRRFDGWRSGRGAWRRGECTRRARW